MKCPVCKNQLQEDTKLRASGFDEAITECCVCGAAWSSNHGAVEIVADPQAESFLEAQTETVEGDDYGFGT